LESASPPLIGPGYRQLPAGRAAPETTGSL